VVGSVPQDVHHDDLPQVAARSRLFRDLRCRHGFYVKTYPLPYCGYHILAKARRLSRNLKERAFRPREKSVDVGLAVLLMRRCLSGSAPDGAVVWTGDSDCVPAIAEVKRCRPNMPIVVAGFQDSLAKQYRLSEFTGYPPLFLDACVAELVHRHGLRRTANHPNGARIRS